MPSKVPGTTSRQRKQKGKSSKRGQDFHNVNGGKGTRHILENQERAKQKTSGSKDKKNKK